MKHQTTTLADWKLESTGGGCQRLRNGRLVITDGGGGVPLANQPCVLQTLDRNGDYDPIVDPVSFGSIEAALAFLNAVAYRI